MLLFKTGTEADVLPVLSRENEMLFWPVEQSVSTDTPASYIQPAAV